MRQLDWSQIFLAFLLWVGILKYNGTSSNRTHYLKFTFVSNIIWSNRVVERVDFDDASVQ
jgi:hypothetical protein